MGRHTEWTQQIEDEAIKYISSFDEHNHAIPSVVGLCDVINIARSTAYKWADDNQGSFSDILEAIKEKQEIVLVSKGLNNQFNPTITKLMLTKHGYHDKQDIDNNHRGSVDVNHMIDLSDEMLEQIVSQED